MTLGDTTSTEHNNIESFATDNNDLVSNTKITLTNNNNNNNNNALTQINQNNSNNKLQTDNERNLNSPVTPGEKEFKENEGELMEKKENKNQSFLKINSSINLNTSNSNLDNNLVSLEDNLDKLDSKEVVNNNIDLKEVLSNKDMELNNKALNDKDFQGNKGINKDLQEKEEFLLDKDRLERATKDGEMEISLVDSFLDPESYKLLQKLPINNPFYRFHKQSNSFREMRSRKHTSFNFLPPLKRKFKSDTDLCLQQESATTAALVFKSADCNSHNFYIKNNIVVVANQNKKHNNNSNTNFTTVTRNQKLDIKFSRQQFNRLQNPNQMPQQQQQQQLYHMQQQQQQQHVLTNKPNDFNNSTVITNPFSIFHDDETHLTLTVDKRLRCASSASRRMLRKPSTSTNSSASLAVSSQPKAFTSQQHLNNYHYLYGVPIKKFERQDFPPLAEMSTRHKKSKLPTSSSSSSVFKQIALRKSSKTASASITNIHVPLTGPQLKRLKISYPNHTQSMTTSASSNSALQSPNKHTYFSRLQAKTKQGFQKLKDKCKQLNSVTTQRSHLGRHHNSSSFKSMSKVESFRFISDRDNIRNYETRCMAAYHQDHKQKQGTLYKSYKSELDLSKNLNYLEAYLNQNFEQPHSAQSVGRSQGQKLRRAFHQIEQQHKETPRKQPLTTKNNYENVQTLPFNKSDSLSSSDYASVFSANCNDQPLQLPSSDKTDLSSPQHLRYEHPKMSEISYETKNLKLKLQKSNTPLRDHQPKELLNDPEVEENEEVFKQELLRICQTKNSTYFDQEEYPLDIPEDEEDELACNNIRILINNSEDFERSPDDDWYMQRSENDNISEVAFYQSLNQQLQQEDLYDPSSLNYDPFITHLHSDLYPFNSETEDEKQLISSSSSLQRSQRLSNSLKYDYLHNAEPIANKSLQLQDYKTAAENAQLMQSLYKTYQSQNKTSTLSNSSSSTSSIHQIPQHSLASQAAPNNKYKMLNHNNPKILNPLPTNYTNSNAMQPLAPRRTSNSSSDNFDSFISARSYPQKIPSKRSSFTQYQQRSPHNINGPIPPSTAQQPPMNVLNYYGVSSSNDTYSIPFKLQSSSSSSNHSSKLSNSSSNSTSSSTHATNPLIIPPSSNHIPPLNSTPLISPASNVGVSIGTAGQINLSKLYNNQNLTSSLSSKQPTPSSSTLLYNQEKRDKFILEYEC